MTRARLVSIVLCLFLVDCSDYGIATTVALDSSINGNSVNYPVGLIFSIELDLNADGGYLWNCEISDTTVVRMYGPNSYRPKYPTNGVGGLTVATLHFQSCGRGYSTIRLTEIQVWRKDVPPLNTVQFNVDVN